MYSQQLCELFGQPARERGGALTAFHKDLARSAQLVLEEVVLEKVRYLATRVDSPNLCMAGGVALNCVANGRVLREGPFERLFVQPAAGDAGGCLGAAALAHRKHCGTRHTDRPLRHVFLGPEPAAGGVARLVEATGVPAVDLRGRDEELIEAVVDRLVRGQVVGWFCGRMEFGPRALGARSILANPLAPEIRERLNRLIKKREDFRPFAPSVLAEHASAHFDLDHASPFMLETCRVTSPLALPGITHVDGSARPQTVDEHAHPRYRALLEQFYRRTGCPLLINTSFNVADEPIVCTAEEALLCMVNADLDALVLDAFLLDRESLPASWPQLVAALFGGYHGPANKQSAIEENLYTFV
jgi:carbamoyltransferase